MWKDYFEDLLNCDSGKQKQQKLGIYKLLECSASIFSTRSGEIYKKLKINKVPGVITQVQLKSRRIDERNLQINYKRLGK